MHEALSLTQETAKTERLGSKNEEHDFASVLVSVPHTLDLVQLENWLNALPYFMHRVKGYVRASKPQFDPAIYVVNKTRQENSIENIKTPVEPSLIGRLVLIGPRDRLLKSKNSLTFEDPKADIVST